MMIAALATGWGLCVFWAWALCRAAAIADAHMMQQAADYRRRHQTDADRAGLHGPT